MSPRRSGKVILVGLSSLARLRIVGMVMVSCAIGFVIPSKNGINFQSLLFSLIGTGLLNAGACTLNCYLERDEDALMDRTRNRPLPAGIVSPTLALMMGASLVVLGTAILVSYTNILSASLGLLAVFIYLMVYVPAKRITWWNTSIGALPGAIPPLIGWSSARGEIEAGGWVLFFMLFLWQHTHFFPIAWLYRSDYQNAGFQMLPVLDATGKKTFFLTIFGAVWLLLTSMLFYVSDLTGPAYCVSSAVSGLLLVLAGYHWSRGPSAPRARTVVVVSLCYLPVLLAAILLDHYIKSGFCFAGICPSR